LRRSWITAWKNASEKSKRFHCCVLRETLFQSGSSMVAAGACSVQEPTSTMLRPTDLR
jgi:hypothetical protein